MKPVTVRPACPDDLPAIVEMGKSLHAARQTHAPFCAHTLAELVAEIAQDDTLGCVLVAECDHDIIGMAAACRVLTWYNRAVPIAQELFWWVAPRARGSLAAKRLMQGMEMWAQRTGCTRFVMTVIPDATCARVKRWHARRGYKPLDVLIHKELQHG